MPCVDEALQRQLRVCRMSVISWVWVTPAGSEGVCLLHDVPHSWTKIAAPASHHHNLTRWQWLARTQLASASPRVALQVGMPAFAQPLLQPSLLVPGAAVQAAAAAASTPPAQACTPGSSAQGMLSTIQQQSVRAAHVTSAAARRRRGCRVSA